MVEALVVGGSWILHRTYAPAPKATVVAAPTQLCAPALAAYGGPPVNTNIVAQFYLDSGWKHTARQRMCDGRSLEVDNAWVKVSEDYATSIYTVTWSTSASTQWLQLSLITSDGNTYTVHLAPTDKDYVTYIPPNFYLMNAMLYGHTTAPAPNYLPDRISVNHEAVASHQPA